MKYVPFEILTMYRIGTSKLFMKEKRMSNFRSLIREIDSYLDRVQDWESTWEGSTLFSRTV